MRRDRLIISPRLLTGASHSMWWLWLDNVLTGLDDGSISWSLENCTKLTPSSRGESGPLAGSRLAKLPTSVGFRHRSHRL